MKRIVAFDDVHAIEGKPDVRAAETRYFGLDGVWYEIDLTDLHSLELTGDFERWKAAGRKIAGAPPKPEPKKNGSVPGRPLGGYTKEFYEALQAHLDERGIPYREQGSKQNRYPPEEKLAFKAEWDKTHGVVRD